MRWTIDIYNKVVHVYRWWTQMLFLLFINLLLEKCFSFVTSHHCFHLTPVVCVEMWEHNRVTPWPRCHADEKIFWISIRSTVCSFAQHWVRVSGLHAHETRKRLWLYLLLCFLLSSRLHVWDVSSTCPLQLTHKRWLELLCCLVTHLETAPLLW